LFILQKDYVDIMETEKNLYLVNIIILCSAVINKYEISIL